MKPERNAPIATGNAPEAARTEATDLAPNEVQALLATLTATGAHIGEALGLTALVHGGEAVLPYLLEAIRDVGTWRPQGVAIPVMDGVATACPDLAQRGLDAWTQNRKIAGSLSLAGRAWVTRLPKGLVVQYALDLQGSQIASLPEGLEVGGNLDLRQAPITSLPDNLYVGTELILLGNPIARLPHNLQVGRFLTIRNCPAWDGRIPGDARVGLEVFTDRHPEGIPLDDFQRYHPNGERA
jgi:hypothetical protein